MTKEKCNIKQTKYLFNSLCFLPVSVNVRECRRGKQNGQSRETGKESTQDEEKQNKNTAQYVLDTTMRKQIRHIPSCKQLKDETSIVFMRKS